VGQTDVGRVVGVGCAPDFRADPAVPVSGFIALQASIEDPRRADRASALLAIVGSVNVPIIYYSVQWWNTLHQGSSIKFSGTSMHVAMQQSMFIMLVACWLYAIAIALSRVRSIILERESNTQWLKELGEVRS